MSKPSVQIRLPAPDLKRLDEYRETHPLAPSRSSVIEWALREFFDRKRAKARKERL